MKSRVTRLLRWSERYTKTDMVYLFHGSFWLMLAQLAAAIAAFGLTVLLANVVAPEVLGEYRFLLAGFALLCVIAIPGIRTAMRESTPKGYRGNLVVAFRAMMRWGSLGSVVAVAIALYYFTQGNNNLALGFVVLAMALPLFNASTAYVEHLTALKEYKRITVYTALMRGALLVITGGAAILYPQYAWIILGAFLLGNILPNLFFHYQTVRLFTKHDDPSDPGLTRYAKHLSAMTALDVVAGQLDKLLVWKFIGAEGLAIFYIAHAIPHEMGRFLGVVPTLAFAKFAVADPQTVRRTLLPKVLKYLFVIACAVGAYIALAPVIFSVLFSQYMIAVPYTQVLALTILGAAFMPIKTYLTSIKDTQALYVLSVIPSALRIVVAILLITKFGIWGAVWSLLTEGAARTIILLFYFLRSNRS